MRNNSEISLAAKRRTKQKLQQITFKGGFAELFCCANSISIIVV